MSGKKVDYKKGDSAWEAAKVQGRGLGRPPKFETADELLECVNGYFEWVKANPLKAAEVKSFKDESWNHDKPIRRPMTIGALHTFLGISGETWRRWKTPDDANCRPDFIDIIHHAEEIIRNDKVEGALVGFYNPTITSRLLGLSEKIEHSGGVTVKMDRDDSGL
jgi:hypothetical protein